jgi:hypothetical protein
MATKKSQSINSQLISGAYKAARSGGYQKSNFKLDLDGVADMLTAKAAANQKLQEEAEEMLDFQPALGKIGENDQGPLLNYFSGVKNEMANIHTEMQGADQETRIRLQGELARLKQTAITANESLTQRSQISEDYAEAVSNRELTGAMDDVRRAQLNKIHIEKDYELILENGQTSYKLPDGSILTNKEANDFKLKAFDQQKAITELSENFFKDGYQNKPLAPDALDMTRQSLMKNLTKDAMESLKADKLLGGQDVIIDEEKEYAAINLKYGTNYKVGDKLPEEHERYGIANNIVGHLKSVHASGMKDYQTKQNPITTGSMPIDGTLPYIDTRNAGALIWYEEFGAYGPGIKNPTGGMPLKDDNLKKDSKLLVKDAQALNSMAVGLSAPFK